MKGIKEEIEKGAKGRTRESFGAASTALIVPDFTRER